MTQVHRSQPKTTQPPQTPTTTALQRASKPPKASAAVALSPSSEPLPGAPLAGVAAESVPRLQQARKSSATNIRLHRNEAPPGQDMPSGARAVLLALGVKPEKLDAFMAGQFVMYEHPSEQGDTTFGTLRLRPDCVEGSVVSVHNTAGNGMREILGFRDSVRDLARAFGKDAVELGGVAVINKKLEEKLKRMGFQPCHLPIPDELGNNGSSGFYIKRFELDDVAPSKEKVP